MYFNYAKFPLFLVSYIALSLCISCNDSSQKKSTIVETPKGKNSEQSVDASNVSYSALNPAAMADYKGSDKLLNLSGCNAILINGTMNTYNYQDYHNYKQMLREALSMDNDELRKSQTNTNIKASIPMPVVDGLINVEGDASHSKDEYDRIVNKYRQNKDLEITEEDIVTLTARTASKDIVNAWSACMGGSEFNYIILGDTFSEFALNLTLIPQNPHSKKSTRIQTVTTTNLQMEGSNNLKKGNTIYAYSGISQQFKRTNKGQAASIVVNVSDYKPVTIELQPYVKPKETAVIETQWFDQDTHGNKYAEIFSTPMPQCYDCDGPGIPVTAAYTLSDPEAKISSIQHWPGCCGVQNWVYNLDRKQLDDRSFRLTAESQGPPCVIQTIVYYKKPRQVCVKNCD